MSGRLLTFQLAAARRRLEESNSDTKIACGVSTRSRPKAAGQHVAAGAIPARVSTRSRPKAAGAGVWMMRRLGLSFNSQPPEGGWQAAQAEQQRQAVSTHSRPKAAGTD